MQILAVLKQLTEVHSKGFVHGDMRTVNVIFSTVDRDAYIIDFDLAGPVNSLYPNNYAIDFRERHHYTIGTQKKSA